LPAYQVASNLIMLGVSQAQSTRGVWGGPVELIREITRAKSSNLLKPSLLMKRKKAC